jgi:hypothetical protein
MNPNKLHYTIIGIFSIMWLGLVIPLVKNVMGFGPVIFPKPPITQLEKTHLLIVSTLLVISLVFKAVSIFKEPNTSGKIRTKITPLLMIVLLSVPLAFGYVFDSDIQSIGQTILNLGGSVMEEDFDEVVPGEDPPGWEETSGDWYAVDDGGNSVYYNDDDGDREALTISTTGDTSWTDYSFLVDVKFVEGPSNKADRAALLVYRYTSGNDYYFLAMREAQDELEVYKHGVGGGGHLRGTVSCTLVQDTWYGVNVTIRGDNVWVSVDDMYYFSNLSMSGSQSQGSVGIGTEYYKVMFDDIQVELRN